MSADKVTGTPTTVAQRPKGRHNTLDKGFLMRHKRHVGPVLAENLRKALPVVLGDWHKLPDGTDVLVGTEWVYASTDSVPKPCAVDLGGDVPFVLWS